MQVFKIRRKTFFLQYRYYFTEPYAYFLVGMIQKEREEGASNTLLIVIFITYGHQSSLGGVHVISGIAHCINDTDLQTITKTQVVGLQKTEVVDFSLSDKF